MYVCTYMLAFKTIKYFLVEYLARSFLRLLKKLRIREKNNIFNFLVESLHKFLRRIQLFCAWTLEGCSRCSSDGSEFICISPEGSLIYFRLVVLHRRIATWISSRQFGHVLACFIHGSKQHSWKICLHGNFFITSFYSNPFEQIEQTFDVWPTRIVIIFANIFSFFNWSFLLLLLLMLLFVLLRPSNSFICLMSYFISDQYELIIMSFETG